MSPWCSTASGSSPTVAPARPPAPAAAVGAAGAQTDAASLAPSDTGGNERPEPRMKVLYRDTVRAQLRDELGLANVMQVPTLTKISVNMGVGAALTNRGLLEGAIDDLSRICGQRPAITRAKQSIAGFKLREGIQFHPESIMTPDGKALLQNYLDKVAQHGKEQPQ